MSGCQKPKILEKDWLKKQKETSHGDENIWYLYFGDGYTQNCITKSS